jgi:type IV pilus assembly protein PilX
MLAANPLETPTALNHHSQRGASLVMVLIFMLLLSMMATFGVRNVTLLQKQTRNELEYQVARQAAEAALRDAEMDLRMPEPTGLLTQPSAACNREGSALRLQGIASAQSAEFPEDCLGGQCGAPATRYAVAWANASTTTKGAPWWPNDKGGDWGNNVTTAGAPSFTCATATGGVPLGTFTGTPRFPGVARQPEYLIELIVPEALGAAATESQFECTGRGGSGSGIKAAQNEVTGGSGAPKGTCLVFRITARGFGASLQDTDIGGKPNPKVEVLLQSYFQLFVK